MTGKIKAVQFGYAFIRSDDGRDMFLHASEMPCDDVGRRYVLPDEEVTFEIGEHQARPCAKAVELVHPRPPADLNGYYEEGRVHKVGRQRDIGERSDPDFRPGIAGEWCFVHRPFGGVAYLHWRDVKSAQSRCSHGISFYVGQLWRYEIKPPLSGNDNDPWCCTNAVEIIEE
jgi:cold shock CspA family protein